MYTYNKPVVLRLFLYFIYLFTSFFFFSSRKSAKRQTYDRYIVKKKKKLFKESKQKDRNEIRYKVFFVCLFVCLFFLKNFKQGTLVLTPVYMYIDFFFF